MPSDAENLAYALSPDLLFKKVVGGDPDPWQSELLRAATSNDPADRKILCLAGRQVGKSRAVSVVAAHHALFTPNSLTVVASSAESQSMELGRQIFAAIHAVDGDVTQENMTSIQLRSGSRIRCLPCAQSSRGLSNAGLVICDESQVLPPEQWAILEPMQAICANPKLIILGTAFTRATKFYEYYKSGDFKVFEQRADQCPRISKQFLEDKLKSLGPQLYAAEFENKWLDDNAQMIGDDLLEAAVDDSYTPLELMK